jgi:hypothetical protein
VNRTLLSEDLIVKVAAGKDVELNSNLSFDEEQNRADYHTSYYFAMSNNISDEFQYRAGNKSHQSKILYFCSLFYQ